MNKTAHDITSAPQGEIVLYQPDATTRLEVRLDEETVWLTQAQIVDLFHSSKANISEHIKSIYQQEELDSLTTVREFRTVRKEEQQNGRTVGVKQYSKHFHDRFLILDDALYHFGASFKDLGKRLFAFDLMGIGKEIILNQL